jgi:transposase
VYGWEQLVLLKHLLEEGLKKTAIAERLGVSRRLVHHWIKTGQLELDLSSDALIARQRQQGPSKLEPYKEIISTRLESYPDLSAIRLFEECRAAGYPGGQSQLRAYVRQVRPKPPVEEVVRFETPAGLQGQVDFGEFRFPWGKRFALLVVLGYSRLLWLQFYPRQTMQVVMRGLEEAFEYFGGVPRELLFDQMKAVIIGDNRAGGGKLLENPEFLRFAAHWGFRIRACRPYRAKTKGKVERPIHYVRHNFVYGREFLGDADLNAQVLTWLDRTANARLHGTTHEVPKQRFEKDERAALLSLSLRPYQSLVLTPERMRAHQAPFESQPESHLPRLERISVERRPLAAYARLSERFIEELPVEGGR